MNQKHIKCVFGVEDITSLKTCYFKDKECFKCKKIGHVAKKCPSIPRNAGKNWHTLQKCDEVISDEQIET